MLSQTRDRKCEMRDLKPEIASVIPFNTSEQLQSKYSNLVTDL